MCCCVVVFFFGGGGKEGGIVLKVTKIRERLRCTAVPDPKRQNVSKTFAIRKKTRLVCVSEVSVCVKDGCHDHKGAARNGGSL